MNDDNDILQAIRRAVGPLLPAHVSPGEVTPGTSLVDDLCLDSLSFFDLIMALEDDLGIESMPAQEFVNEQLALGEHRFLVSALADVCRRCLSGAEA